MTGSSSHERFLSIGIGGGCCGVKDWYHETVIQGETMQKGRKGYKATLNGLISLILLYFYSSFLLLPNIVKRVVNNAGLRAFLRSELEARPSSEGKRSAPDGFALELN